MLKQRSHDHLSTDQLLQALVDPPDLGKEWLAHLKTCPTCRKALERLKQGFGRLGRTAVQMAPAPSRPFRLPPKAAAATGLHFKPMWATVAAGVLLVAFAVWWPHPLSPPGSVPSVAVRSPEAGGSLFDQVDALVEDPLPPVLQALATASGLDDTNDNLERLVPAVGETQNDDPWI
jgi:hypothetical protein